MSKQTNSLSASRQNYWHHNVESKIMLSTKPGMKLVFFRGTAFFMDAHDNYVPWSRTIKEGILPGFNQEDWQRLATSNSTKIQKLTYVEIRRAELIQALLVISPYFGLTHDQVCAIKALNQATETITSPSEQATGLVVQTSFPGTTFCLGDKLREAGFTAS